MSLLKSGVVKVVPVEFAMVVVVMDVVDGKLSDGNERGGIVGTDNGGNPGDVYDGVAGIPAATGGTDVNVELGRVLTDGIAGVVNGLGVYDGTAPIVGSVDVTGTLGVDRLGSPVGEANEGTAVGTAPPGTDVVACGKVGARVAVGAGVLNGT